MVRYSSVLSVQKSAVLRCSISQINGNSEHDYFLRQGSGRGSQNWIDSLRVFVKGGHGGNGFPKYGAVGGKGGDVIIKCSDKVDSKKNKSRKKVLRQPELKSLYEVFDRTFHHDSSKQRLKAGEGEGAHRNKLIGQSGSDKILQVPVGVSVRIDEPNSQNFLANLDQVGDEVRVAIGGTGGGPNNSWIGQKGQSLHVRLDLRLIADLGLVGFPNAGKSTLLKAISKARPKIASYPFTTIKPNLGHIVYEDEREISMADLPGLIEGAHINVGLGHKFLKHVERTLCNVFVIDIQGFQLNPSSARRSALETLILLNKELEMYNPDLLSKPAICIVNKMDTQTSNDSFDDLVNRWSDIGENYEENLLNIDETMWPETRINFLEMIPISAKHSNKTVQYVKNRIRTHLDNIEDKKTNFIETIYQVSDELDVANADKAPRIA